MTAGVRDNGPAIEYLLKEVSFSTCDNRFFGELEKEMLIPSNINIYGRITGADSLRGYKLQLEFPEESAIGYIRQPLSNTTENHKRILAYNLEELINYDDYWWLPLEGETEFSVALNLLPPFPNLNPVDLAMSCQPDVAGGLEADVTTNVRLEAGEQIDNVYLKFTAPFVNPGISMSITAFSGDNVNTPRPSVNVPAKQFPFPRLALGKGQVLEYKVTTRINANPSSMSSLRCQQDILSTKLILLSRSTSAALPCGVKVVDDAAQEVPVNTTIRSTILQANAQIMYSPFSIRREQAPRPQQPVLFAPTR
jgi:hypothetical protein